MDFALDPRPLKLDPENFPNSLEGCTVKSPEDPAYNCIAFAAGETKRFWWPNKETMYWPDGIPAKETVNSFLKLFQSLGYKNCRDGSHEIGFEKVAIYALNNKVKHVARQLPDGAWVSKLGSDVDIEHETVKNLEGPFYGEVARFLKRPLKYTDSS